MPPDTSGRSLFIVDNSVSSWTGLRYLAEWADIARAFDIATGYFEIGALLALDGKWQPLDKLRILMGTDTTHRTRKALLDAVTTLATERLDGSMEEEKGDNPFLRGVPGVLEALRTGQIEVRVYDKDKFHAKAYITHAKLEVVGSQALVGSSNFTRPGLTKNIELNIQVQSAREVAQLQEWYETHWKVARDVSDAVIHTIERQTRDYNPFDIYAKALQEYFRGHELTESEWEDSRSRMFPVLDRYQKEAYWRLMKIASNHGGAFLCDGVGLGKTFVGLMLIERLILHEGKRVVLFAPKTAKEAVWERDLKRYLPHIGGVSGGADFSNLAVFSHSDLGRKGEFPDRFRRMTELADVVIVDEAHHFRNTGRRADAEKGIEPSRYHLLYDLLDDATRHKTLYMLTATPINNSLHDFRHMVELFSRRQENYFSRSLGIHNLRSHTNQLERDVRSRLADPEVALGEMTTEAQDVLAADPLIGELVVQRSRSYARESQLREHGRTAVFPIRKPPQVADYSIRKSYGRLLDKFEQAFRKEQPLFVLPMYYPLAFYQGPDTTIDPLEESRQKEVVGLIRTQFLKRFESSVAAFELSCNRLLKKLLAFLEVHCETVDEKRLYERTLLRHKDVLGYVKGRQHELWGEDQEEPDEDLIPQVLLEAVQRLDRADYKVPDMIHETLQDVDQIAVFLEEARRFKSKDDDKLRRLIGLLKSKDLAGEKVLIFTEFADTARYLKRQLRDNGIAGVAEVDGSSQGSRAEVIARFAPYYNGSSSSQVDAAGGEIRVLISTDVLSEGLNLQDASRMVNYDIHWNPVRLMQRIGRVDRRLNPDVEARLVADHPNLASSRGVVHYWNFLPPDELNELLSLYRVVTRKTLLISRTLGIEGGKLLRPEDTFDDLKILNALDAAYEGSRTVVEDLHLEYQALLAAMPELEERLKRLPGSVFSGRERAEEGLRGVFFCYALPALDKETSEFSLEAGPTRWYLADLEQNRILEEPGEIVAHVRSTPDTARRCMMDEALLKDWRGRIEKHIKGTYLKRVDAPIGVKPALRCWMEVN
jgi:superfamily II DNA or RNA helicase